MSFFVRVKRSNQTMFITCEATDSFLKLKSKISDIGRLDPHNIKLYAADKTRILEDEASLGDMQVGNDCIVYAVYKKEGGDEWETISIIEFGAEKEGGEFKNAKN